MKKILFGALAAVVLTACGNSHKTPSSNETLENLLASRLEHASNWEDSVIAVNGTFMGGYFNYNLHADPELSSNLNMKEVERGIRQVMATDTTDMSYIYGIQVGMTILNTFKEISMSMPVDKAKLMESIMGALRLDSVDRDQLLEIRREFEKMDSEVKKRHEAEIDQEIYSSREANENRLFAEAFEAKLISNPDFKKIGDGIYCKVETEGSGETFQPTDKLRATYTILRLSGEPVENASNKAMFAGHAPNPMLNAVLKYMKPGEKAQFFVPYTAGYGIQGNPEAGIGPCESLLLFVDCNS